ncbi:Octopamine receptor in mushroom bodies, partial [Carabus blaptoides fortunei]
YLLYDDAVTRKFPKMLNLTDFTNIICDGEEQFEVTFSKPLLEETLIPKVLPIRAINNTALVETFPDFNNPLILLEAFFLGLIILLTISGNLLVIVAVVPSPTLRSPTHSLIVNLAVADLLLGITVLPLSATRELYAGAWLLGPSLCSVWTSLD